MLRTPPSSGRGQALYQRKAYMEDDFKSLNDLVRFEDTVLMVVKREIAGQTKYFLERLSRRFCETDDIRDAFFVDCGKTYEFEKPGAKITDLEHLAGARVLVLADGKKISGLTVAKDGTLQLPYAANKVTVGLPFNSLMAPMPLEADTDTGTSLGKRRAYGKCVLRVSNSAGGKYAATKPGDLWDSSAWQGRDFFEIPYPDTEKSKTYKGYSGDIELSIPSGQDTDTSLWILQNEPLPMRIIAIAPDVDVSV